MGRWSEDSRARDYDGNLNHQRHCLLGNRLGLNVILKTCYLRGESRLPGVQTGLLLPVLSHFPSAHFRKLSYWNISLFSASSTYYSPSSIPYYLHTVKSHFIASIPVHLHKLTLINNNEHSLSCIYSHFKTSVSTRRIQYSHVILFVSVKDIEPGSKRTLKKKLVLIKKGSSCSSWALTQKPVIRQCTENWMTLEHSVLDSMSFTTPAPQAQKSMWKRDEWIQGNSGLQTQQDWCTYGLTETVTAHRRPSHVHTRQHPSTEKRM